MPLDTQQIAFDGELNFASFKINKIYTHVPNNKSEINNTGYSYQERRRPKD
jgi:hypothetical protein